MIDQRVRILSLDSDDDESNDSDSGMGSHVYKNLRIPTKQADIETMSIERKIYLRAALKLLDQRDQSMIEKQANRRQRDGSTSDIIKYGTLKKSSGGAVARVWKEKYVELRHGSFSYEDYSGWGDTYNCKTIKLVVKKVKCHTIKSGPMMGRFVFGISDIEGQKRFWMADSAEEMQSWVNAIKTAMIGSAGDFAIVDADDSPSVANDSSYGGEGDVAGDLVNTSTLLRPMNDAEEECKLREKKGQKNGCGSFGYWGPEMQRCLSVQSAIINARTAEAYRDLLSMYTTESVFTIPVSFMKQLQECTPISSGLKQSTEKKSRSKKEKVVKRFVSTECSQAWKDLHRDVMTINGDEISGGIDGPEAMLGSLVRHILLQVEEMRNRYVDTPTPSHPSSTQHMETIRRKLATYADLDEGLALSCARDILLCCNRTQSGGDTYYIVESLLVNKNFAVLTPLACEADPLEIIVDIVESGKRAKPVQEEKDGSDYSVSDVGSNPMCEEKLQKSTASQDRVLATDMIFSDGGDTVDTPPNRCTPKDREDVDAAAATVKHLSDKWASGGQKTQGDDTTDSSGHTQHSVSVEGDAKSRLYYPEIPRNSCNALVSLPTEIAMPYLDATDVALQSDIPGATAIPSRVLLAKDIGLRRTVSQTRSSHPPMSEDSVCVSSDMSNYTEASTNSSARGEYYTYAEDEREEPNIDEAYDSMDSNDEGIPRPFSTGSVLLPSHSVRRLSVDSEDGTPELAESPTAGSHRSMYRRSYSERDRPGAVPSAVSTYTPDEEATVAISEITFESNVERRPRKRSSAFKKMLMASPGYRKHSNTVNLQDGPLGSNAPKSRFVSFKFGSTRRDNSSSPSMGDQGKKADDDCSVGSGNTPNTPHKRNYLLRKAFGAHNKAADSGGSILNRKKHNKQHAVGNTSDSEVDSDSAAAQSMCIRIQVIAKSKYRLCNLDPQNEDEDNWAIVSGSFHQVFFLKSNSNGRPSVSDRLVTVKVDQCR